MSEVPYYSITQMVEDFDSYPRQIRALIARDGIPNWKIGNARVVDEAGYRRVKKAIDEFRRALRERPRLMTFTDSASR